MPRKTKEQKDLEGNKKIENKTINKSKVKNEKESGCYKKN